MIKGVNYLFTVYGDFQEISATPEVINKLMELFKEFKEVLIPMSIQLNTEISNSKIPSPSTKGFMSLIFMNSAKTLAIEFTGTRIDIRRIESNRALENDLAIFENEIIFILSKVFKEFKKKARRLALVQNFVSKEVSDEKIEKIFSKIFALPKSMMDNEKRDWNFRVVNRTPVKIKEQNEVANSILIFGRTTNRPPVFVDLAQNKFAFTTDFNTIPEKNDSRFDVEEISEFYKNSILFQKEQVDLFIKHIEL